LFNELAQATKTTDSTNNSIVPAAVSPTVSTNGTDTTSGTSSSDTLATDLASLLKALGSGDVSGAKAALTQVEADLQAQNANSPTASTPLSSSTSSTRSSSSSQSTNPLTNLLNQLSTALNSGNTGSALQDLTSFLLTTGQSSGSAVNVTA
jgi:hypothetical protein